MRFVSGVCLHMTPQVLAVVEVSVGLKRHGIRSVLGEINQKGCHIN